MFINKLLIKDKSVEYSDIKKYERSEKNCMSRIWQKTFRVLKFKWSRIWQKRFIFFMHSEIVMNQADSLLQKGL